MILYVYYRIQTFHCCKLFAIFTVTIQWWTFLNSKYLFWIIITLHNECNIHVHFVQSSDPDEVDTTKMHHDLSYSFSQLKSGLFTVYNNNYKKKLGSCHYIYHSSLLSYLAWSSLNKPSCPWPHCRGCRDHDWTRLRYWWEMSLHIYEAMVYVNSVEW